MIETETYKELVEKLGREVYHTKIRGVNARVKPIPDLNDQGGLDTREKAVLDEMFSSDDFVPIPDIQNLDIADIPISEIRQSMGFPNVDITEGTVHNEAKNIVFNERIVPVSIYQPKEALENMPGVLYFHGGAFLGGSLDVVENVCKLLAERLQAVVVSVDYSLAPEKPFPNGFNDCFAALEWLYHHAVSLNVNPERLLVMGDSAGGNLAGACALKDRAMQKNMISHQVLIYPSLNMGQVERDGYHWGYDLYTIKKDTSLILKSINFLKDQLPLVVKTYLQDGTKVTHPYVSPLFAENLEGLPNTLMVTAEYDMFRIENEVFAQKLLAKGVDVELLQYNGLGHGFIDKVGVYPQVEDCIKQISEWLSRSFKN